jgi:hypothetical protein
MKHNQNNPGKILDQAIDGIRQDSASAEATDGMAQASARVLQRMREEYNKVVPHPSMETVDRIESCADFRSLIPAYLTASLTPARRLLFEDHVRECVGCRKALEAARKGSSQVASAPASVRRFQPRHLKWAASIAALLLVGVALQTGPVRDLIWPIDVHATVQVVDGGLFNVSGQNVSAVKAGARIERGQAVRTGAASGAMLELADGTRIEMAARSELSLGRARDGVKVQLARGNVIVRAAKQHGHLYVETSDCSVAVVGTVFSVHSGVKGSRVVVIEGEVHVTQDGADQSLFPGDQTVTNPAMGEVSPAQEIAWSREAEEWMKELSAFGQDMAAKAGSKAMRHDSKLIGLVPADTLVVASLPNVAQEFRDSYLLFRQRVSENGALATWWRQADRPSNGMNLDEMADRIAEVGAYIGSEVVFAFPKEMKGRGPVLLAEAARPDQLVSAIEGDLRRLAEVSGGRSEFQLARNKAELTNLAAKPGDDAVIYVGDGLMIVSDAAQVARTLAIHEGKVSGNFPGTPLGRRLAQAYTEGVGWLLAIDLQQMIDGEREAQQLGFANVQQLVLEQKTGVGSAASRVALAFAEERRGIAAWLGAPAPMGALDFVSPDAYGFSSWVVKDPELILDDIFKMVGDNPLATQHLKEMGEKHGLDLRRDLAEPLGNEVLVGIDGPILPTPSWKVVLEVNDLPRLENAIQYAVTNLNREAQMKQAPEWSLESETVNGKTFHSLTSKGFPMEIHYTSWMGYMLIAPRRALLTEAIRIHDSGNSIGRSAAFRAEMPPDGRDIASGIMYQNVESIARSIPAAVTDPLSGSMQNELKQMSALQKSWPKVAVVYGEQDRILGAAKGSFGINIASMLGMQGMVHAAGMGSPGRR